MVGRTLTAVLWGVIADRYGRKPVMLTSILGMSSGIQYIIWPEYKLLDGNGYKGKASKSETLLPKPYLGRTAGHIVQKFAEGNIKLWDWQWFPYFLVSLVISAIALVVTFLCFWLPETLHNHSHCSKIQDEPHDVEDVAISTLDDDQKQKSARETAPSWLTLLKNWPYMSTLIGFSVFQLQDMAYAEIFSLWTVTPRSIGGVGLTSVDVGQALAVSGVGLLLCQVLIYPTLEKYFGPITIARVGAVLSIALLSSFPFIAKLSGVVLTVLIDLASTLKNVFATQQQRGTASGLSLCLMSFCKAISPAAAGYLNASDGSFPSRHVYH
ncbi:hypothetical protein Cgig2_003660 [Carnegiea gigantea]|uniref:Major facilitator superfamily (MFS) profile domain-containing protein n=1 Tax=Carnegiea gigantea TaxID=171969 RepID=A0A9Q1GKZ2_9CARY|nr:hypothetical protein Cgig2_003660 [Carnegiea gigantea]